MTARKPKRTPTLEEQMDRIIRLHPKAIEPALLRRFEHVLRAAVRAERKACAEECMELAREWDANDQAFYANAGELCARAIARRKP